VEGREKKEERREKREETRDKRKEKKVKSEKKENKNVVSIIFGFQSLVIIIIIKVQGKAKHTFENVCAINKCGTIHLTINYSTTCTIVRWAIFCGSNGRFFQNCSATTSVITIASHGTFCIVFTEF